MIPLESKIKVLRTLVTRWGGQIVDDDGLIRLFNASGTRPPLIWCFNAEREPSALARALGPDQPLIAVRSLNIAVDFTKKSPAEDSQIAEHYLNLILQRFSLMRCRVGGNCQGAAVAAEMANLLVLKKVNVMTSFSMEWMPFMPFPGHCALIFGDRSHENNPFLSGLDPWEHWRHMFGKATCQFIPGEHGTFFEPTTVDNLASTINRTATTDIGAVTSDWAWAADLSGTVGANQRVNVNFTTAEPLPESSRIYAVWVSRNHGVPQFSDLYRPSLLPSGYAIALRVPPEAGTWALTLFCCDSETGPRCFGKDLARSRQVIVDP